MPSYIEYLHLPATVMLILAGIFAVIQVIGEILEFKGKVVPEFVKIRKYFARRKRERDMLHQLPDAFNKIKTLIDDFESHYSKDNIAMRDQWMEEVNRKLHENDSSIKELNDKMDQNNEHTLSLLIDSKRNTIITFASHVIDEGKPVTREQFNRVFKIYEEYEEIIRKNNLTNGEVDIAIHIIRESYEQHMRAHTFVEDIRGY